jgi:hypothetical protein
MDRTHTAEIRANRTPIPNILTFTFLSSFDINMDHVSTGLVRSHAGTGQKTHRFTSISYQTRDADSPVLHTIETATAQGVHHGG